MAAPARSSAANTPTSSTAAAASATRSRRKTGECTSAPAKAASRARYWPISVAPSFDSPCTRSVNVIGTSSARRLAPPRESSSSRILKPAGASPRSSSAWRRAAKKPDIGSLTTEIGQASAEASFETMRRCSGQPRIAPPRTCLLPTATSALPSSTARASAGTASGGCDRSASMTTTTSARASRAPRITAPASPRAPRRITARTG